MYGNEILQLAADMVSDADGKLTKLVIWTRLLVDLSLNVTKQQIEYTGGSMQHETPHYIKRNGIISGILLVPFFVTIITNRVAGLLYGQDLRSSWLWRPPIIGTWVLILPLLAFLLASISYMTYIFHGGASSSLVKRLLNVLHSWPILLTGTVAFSIIFVMIFHDSVHCWVQNPVHLVSDLGRTWQCSEQGSVNLIEFLNRAL